MTKTHKNYKHQHWLPFSYMKGFADSIEKANRKSARFYKFDGKNQKSVKVVKECRDDFFYSKRDPKDAESKFWRMENDFPNFVEKLQKNQSLDRKESRGMIINIFLLHFRNASYENRTKEERTKALDQAFNTFLAKEISEVSNEESKDLPNLLKGLRNWQLEVIVTEGEKFITSDHPAIFFNLAEKKLVMAGLPIKPNLFALAYDRRKIAVTPKKATERDVSIINAYEAGQSIANVYSSEKFPDTDITALKNIFKNKRRPQRGYFGEKEIDVEYIRYNKATGKGFSFLLVK